MKATTCLLLVCIATAGAVGTSTCGVPCSGTSSVWAASDTALTGNTLEVYVITRDCYGEIVRYAPVDFHARDSVDTFIGSPAVTDAHGFASVLMTTETSGMATVSVTSFGFILGPTYVHWTDPRAFFQAHFMTPDSLPYPFDVTISDGEWVQEFEDVTYIDVEVPASATYTCVYEVPGFHDVMNQFELSFEHGETREFMFFAYDPRELEERTTAYVSFQEVGDQPIIIPNYDPIGKTLHTKGLSDSGKIFDANVYIDTDTRQPPEYCVKRGEGKKSSWTFFVCLLIGIDYKFCSTDSFSLTFEEVDSADVRLGFRKALYKKAIVDTFGLQFQSMLRTVEGTPLDMEFAYPQYSVPPGNYLLTAQGLPEGFDALELPIRATVGTPVLLDLYPTRTADLEAYTFGVAAEYFFSNSSFSNMSNAQPCSITVDVATEEDRDWWGYFVLPDTGAVGSIYAYTTGGGATLLEEPVDYTVNDVDGFTLVVVRIEPTYTRLRMMEAPAGIDPQHDMDEPVTLVLHESRPNPFSVSTEIRYGLDEAGYVNLSIYDILGRRVSTLVSGYQDRGAKSVFWPATDESGNRISSGIYFYELDVGGHKLVRKVVLLR